MASNERVRRVRSVGGRVPFPHLIVGTLLAVSLTMLLGIATKAAGAGLACNAQWPLCDGGLLNLFPATLPSFFEWIHRVVAGVTGFVILGAAVAAWRGDVPRGVRPAVTLGLVLLPIQVLLGRETVLTFTVPVLMAHFWTAFTIFASFVVATVLTWRAALTPARLRAAAVGAAALVPLQVLLHPPVVTSFTPPVQTVQVAVTLSAFALLVAVAVGGRRQFDGPAALAVTALPVVHPLSVLAGRHLFTPSTAVLAGYLVAAAALVAGALAAALAFHRTAS